MNMDFPEADGQPASTDQIAQVVQFTALRKAGAAPVAAPIAPAQVSFDRRELNALLNLYGKRVAQGEWRDYAMDFQRDRAVFSVFRRTSEAPLYRIEKQPRLERRQGKWSVVNAAGMVLKRGNDLARVLTVIDKPVDVVRPWDR